MLSEQRYNAEMAKLRGQYKQIEGLTEREIEILAQMQLALTVKAQEQERQAC